MIAFTICARNFLAHAQVLHDSLERYHPGVAFHVALCDAPGDLEVDAFPFSILVLEDLGIPDLPGMIDRYNITELNTSIKPFVFAWLFDRFPGEPVLYFDPDIIVLGPLEELQAELADGADCVLTPHIGEPAEYAEMHEGRFLSFGVYNLGFCALRGTDEVRRIVAWWGRRLERQCVIDLPAGLFVDQKWADLLPAFIERTKILRHPGYNVAYWNLSRRTVRRTPAGWLVNGRPLRFFHFSGSVLDEPPIFSRHSGEFRLETLRDAGLLFHDYIAEVNRFGRAFYKAIPFAFSWDGAAGHNVHTPREVALRSLQGARPGGLAAGETAPHLPLLRARSCAEYQAVQALGAERASRRRVLEAGLIPKKAEPFCLDGFCAVCGRPAALACNFRHHTQTLPDGRTVPDWREQLECGSCGFTNHQRAFLHVLFQEARPAPDAKMYFTEPVTPLFRWLQSRFPALVGSEHPGAGRIPGAAPNAPRHEDLRRLSFPDATFDLILGSDAPGGVAFERQAFAGFARCLKPGGMLVFAVPFDAGSAGHPLCGQPGSDGCIGHRAPAAGHGNHVDAENGARCFHSFGWEVIDDLRGAGFIDPVACFSWSRSLGYLGETSTILIARRAPA